MRGCLRHDTKAEFLRAVVLVVLTASAVVMLTFLFQNSASWGFYSLFAVPVAVAGRHLGVGAGVAVALAAVGTMILHASVAGIDIGPSGFTVRAAALIVVVLVAAPRGMFAANDELEGTGAPPTPRLTPREVDVLRLLALGHTNQETADRLYLSVRTVESHRARVQQKLGRRKRSELTAYAFAKGLIHEPASADASRPPAQTSLAPPPVASTRLGVAFRDDAPRL